MISPLVWAVFLLIVFLLMYIDLGVLNKDSETPSIKEATRNTIVWILLGLSFTGAIYYMYDHQIFGLGTYEFEQNTGRTAAVKYFTGYLLEEALSVDNLFVMALIFAQFRTPKKYQHKILFWGIIGVLVFRAILIAVGSALVTNFVWVFVAFGLFLIWSGIKMLRHNEDDENDFHNNGFVKFTKRFFPVTSQYDGDKFFTLKNGVKTMTPLFVTLLVIEATDVMFAFDSVPAVLSITKDPFLVFSSNIFAILGLRSLFFVIASVMDKFVYLNYSLVLILIFIGVKMILIPFHIHIEETTSLLVLALILGAGVIASYAAPKKGDPKELGTDDKGH
jgi:tellurite resistance protein TerC